MKLHTDTLAPRHIHAATGPLPGVYADVEPEGSRSRDHGYVIHLTADQRKGRRRTNNTGHRGSGYESEYAATWDEWGLFFAHLFTIDANLICGENYSGVDHYQWCTGNRFIGTGGILNVGTAHDQHRWVWDGSNHRWHQSTCKGKCGAIRRDAFRNGDFTTVMQRAWADRRYPIAVPA